MTSRRRVGVMGGTFDPIHHGHLVAASEVQAWFDLDEVVFVPTGTPWQKSHRTVSAAEHRYLMTVIATESNPNFRVSRVDIDRGGPTYTIDTLRDLHADASLAGPGFINFRLHAGGAGAFCNDGVDQNDGDAEGEGAELLPHGGSSFCVMRPAHWYGGPGNETDINAARNAQAL